MNEITIIRSNRKSLQLKVDENCRVILRAPVMCPNKLIEQFLEEKHDWIEKAIKRQKERMINRIELDESDVKKLKEKAAEYLPERVAYFAEIMNVNPKGVKITSAKKRFGSCNTENSLCFSYLLMLYPSEAIDYVVVHELAHIRYHNHGKLFYNFIKSVMPDYKEREKLLKT